MNELPNGPSDLIAEYKNLQAKYRSAIHCIQMCLRFGSNDSRAGDADWRGRCQRFLTEHKEDVLK